MSVLSLFFCGLPLISLRLSILFNSYQPTRLTPACHDP